MNLLTIRTILPLKINIPKTIETALKAYGRRFEKDKWYPDLIGAQGRYERIDYVLYDNSHNAIAALYYTNPSNAAALWCVRHNLKLIVFRTQEYEAMKDPAYIEEKIAMALGLPEGSGAVEWLSLIHI